MQTIINLRTLKAIGRAMGTEKTRYYLRGVYLEATAESVIYVATQDRVLLARRESIKDAGEPIAGPFIGSLIIPAAIVNGFKVKKNDNGFATLSTEDGKEFTVNFNGDKRTFSPIDGTFPDWRRVLPPQPYEYKTPAQFQGEYVDLMAKASVDLGLGATPFIFQNGDAPAIVQFTDPDTFGVIMPFKGPKPGESISAPAWVRDPKPSEETAAT